VRTWDAIAIGSGPNGLSAAASVARAGLSVLVIEAADEIGGGARTLALTLPGFLHDICSAIHPLAVSSPAFTAMPQFGLAWIHPEIPLDGRRAVTLERSLRAAATNLGKDADAYHRLFAPIVANWATLTELSTGKIGIPQDAVGLLRVALAESSLPAQDHTWTLGLSRGW
jgi:phytoene dehydrogenase-like protein